jgi:hypothetical protein
MGERFDVDPVGQTTRNVRDDVEPGRALRGVEPRRRRGRIVHLSVDRRREFAVAVAAVIVSALQSMNGARLRWSSGGDTGNKAIVGSSDQPSLWCCAYRLDMIDEACGAILSAESGEATRGSDGACVVLSMRCHSHRLWQTVGSSSALVLGA